MTVAGCPLVYVNESFTALTGYARHEACGRNCRFLQGPRTEPEHLKVIAQSIRKGIDCLCRLINYTKAGVPFENLLALHCVYDSSRTLRFSVALQMDPSTISVARLRKLVSTLPAAVTLPPAPAVAEARAQVDPLPDVPPTPAAHEVLPDVPPTPAAHEVLCAAAADDGGEGGGWPCPVLGAFAKAAGVEIAPRAGLAWCSAFQSIADELKYAILLVDVSCSGLPISYCNAAFTTLTGYPRSQAVGRNCRFLQCAATEPSAVAQMVAAIRAGAPTRVRLTNQRQSGSHFVNDVSLHPVHDSSGAYRFVIGLLAPAQRGSEGRHSRDYASLRRLRSAAPRNFDAQLQPLEQPARSTADAPTQWGPWASPMSKFVRMAWSLDGEGTLRRLLGGSCQLGHPALASLGQFLSQSDAGSWMRRDVRLLELLVLIQMMPQGASAPLAAVQQLCVNYIGRSASGLADQKINCSAASIQHAYRSWRGRRPRGSQRGPGTAVK